MTLGTIGSENECSENAGLSHVYRTSRYLLTMAWIWGISEYIWAAKSMVMTSRSWAQHLGVSIL